MPAWAHEALEPAPFAFIDLLLDTARYFNWTIDYCLDMPVRRFWLTVEHIRVRRQEQADAARDNPLAALALLLGR